MKQSLDLDLAIDVGLALPSWREWYDYSRHYRACLAKKLKAGKYDKAKAVKGYERLVYDFCHRLPYFRRFYADIRLNLPTRVAIAERMEQEYFEEIGGYEHEN